MSACEVFLSSDNGGAIYAGTVNNNYPLRGAAVGIETRRQRPQTSCGQGVEAINRPRSSLVRWYFRLSGSFSDARVPVLGGKFNNFDGGQRVNAFFSGGWIECALRDSNMQPFTSETVVAINDVPETLLELVTGKPLGAWKSSHWL